MFRSIYSLFSTGKNSLANSRQKPQPSSGSLRSRLKARKKRPQSPLTTINDAYQSLETRCVLSAYFPAYAGGQFTLGDANASSPYPLNKTFQLETNPNATKTIYLDFTGHHSHSNAWNHNIRFGRYDTDGRSAFSTGELTNIQRVFQNVAEDFAPFNVNVTTRDPGYWDLTKSNSSDVNFGVRVVFTQQAGGFGDGYGGIAKVGVFDDSRDTPVFVFAKTTFNNTAIIASHEAGHALGLTHDGLRGRDYHPGAGAGETSWGPIMGAAYYRNLTQWSNGDYLGSDNRQDDIATITNRRNGIDFRTDDAGNTFATAKNLKFNGQNIFNWGIVEQSFDVDTYRFTTDGGTLNLDISPFEQNPNLDIRVRLYDSARNLISSYDPADQLEVSLNKTLSRGTYFIKLDGVGKAGAYSDYGSLGFYTISGTLRPTDVSNQETSGETGVIENVTEQWKTVRLAKTYTNPIVVVGPTTNRNADPHAIRVRNVTGNSFQVRVAEWDYLDGDHPSERAGFIVLEKGTHVMLDGTTIIAGEGSVEEDYRRIGFGGHFSKSPVVLSQVTTNRGGETVTTRVRDVKTGSFEVKLQEQESSDQNHRREKISWIAFDRRLSNGNFIAESLNTGSSVTDQNFNINFQQTFGSTPIFLAGMQTENGTDTATIRINAINSRSVNLFLDEEASLDSETAHTHEVVGYVAINPGLIRANSSLSRIQTANFRPVAKALPGESSALPLAQPEGAFGAIHTVEASILDDHHEEDGTIHRLPLPNNESLPLTENRAVDFEIKLLKQIDNVFSQEVYSLEHVL